MNFKQLLIGLLLGAILGFGATKYFTKPTTTDNPSSSAKWTWPDSLDAANAAPENHHVVYEDSTVRVLQVLLDGHKEEPIHTHKWKSIMWISKPADPCTIYQYDLDKNGKFAVTDSVNVPHMDTDIGFPNDAEGPTGIKNLGSDNGIAYRVEFKKEFKP
ncbi:hypothetical protein [Dyadobacter psychrotolerans]|uniref:Uncharacterized protein n=1 Tax=Dyadobacter psychrotolerans TaxID=2541721 RepID=A0A4R5DVI2_9BACT|nr:hypothetical protein [Dyadobacter psychrotolerans]TDE15245.1 hypothetical protein E0F88_12025 [Dyadobacter psychrotolerans]